MTLRKSVHCLGLTFPNLWIVWQPLPVCATMASLVLEISIGQDLKPLPYLSNIPVISWNNSEHLSRLSRDLFPLLKMKYFFKYAPLIV